jgi:3-keto-disaccharide hydrolase
VDRRLISIVAAVAGWALTGTVAAQTSKINFETDAVGAPPKQFSFALTGQGKPGAWVVRQDDQTHGHVLAQTEGDPTDYRFPVAIYEGVTAANLDLSVEFKTIAGKVDQGAGLVWRYRDQHNYYVTRCNALEDNCTIYHVVDGRRRAFLNHNVKVTSNAWHTLRVQARGSRFVVTYDGAQVLDATDETFKGAGRIGLWTKADSVIYFDNLSVAVAP